MNGKICHSSSHTLVLLTGELTPEKNTFLTKKFCTNVVLQAILSTLVF